MIENPDRDHPPVVLSDDPVGSGFLESLNRPSWNVTGLSFLSSELTGKRLELLREAVPRASRVAVLWNPANPSAERQVRAAEAAAPSVGARLQRFAARSPEEFDGVFAAMKRSRVEALLVVDDPMFLDYVRQIADRATSARLPAVYGFREFVEASGLISYGPSLADTFLRSATFVDKILQGGRPGDLPVEQPTKFELVINLTTAEALSLTISQSVLVRADEVIK
jgi:putative ABC transport system substrate-binding protein